MDARLSYDYDVDDEAIALDRIIWALQPVRRLRLILLDACRDNPFAAKLRSASRSPTRGGLAKLEDISADTLVAFAAKAGSISYDGDGVNSPYATALLRHLAEPGVDIRIALGRVRDEVIAMTGGRQEPFIYGSLGGATISLVPQSGATNVALVASPLAAAPIPPPVPVPALPKPVVANPTPPSTPPVVKAELPKPPPLPAQPAPEITDPCVRDETRLARLRANPTPDEIIDFQREVACKRLRPQVERLFESFVSDITSRAEMLRRNRLRNSRRRTSLLAPKIPVPATRRVSYACALSLRARRSPSSRRSWAASSSGLSSADCARALLPDVVQTTRDSALGSTASYQSALDCPSSVSKSGSVATLLRPM